MRCLKVLQYATDDAIILVGLLPLYLIFYHLSSPCPGLPKYTSFGVGTRIGRTACLFPKAAQRLTLAVT